MDSGADDLVARQATQPSHSLVEEGRKVASAHSACLRPCLAQPGGFRIESNTTVVNSMIVWHYVVSDEGGRDAPDGGSEDGEVVDRGTGGAQRMPLGAFRPLRGAPAGARL